MSDHQHLDCRKHRPKRRNHSPKKKISRSQSRLARQGWFVYQTFSCIVRGFVHSSRDSWILSVSSHPRPSQWEFKFVRHNKRLLIWRMMRRMTVRLDKTSDHRHLDCRKHCPKRRNHSPKKKISRSQSRLARQGWFVYQTFSCIVRGFVHSSRDSWILSVSSHPRPSQWEFKFVRHNKRLLIWRMMRRMTVRLDKTSDHRHLDCRKHCPKRRNHSPKKKISRSQSRLARQGWFVYQTFCCIVRGFVHSSRDSWILSVSSHPRPSQWEFKFVRHNKRLLIWRMMRRMTVRLDKTSDHRHLDCRKHRPKRRNHSPKKKISRSQSRLARQGWFVYQTFSCIVRGFVHSSRDSWILSVSSHPRPSQWEFKFVRHNKRLLIWRMMRRMTVRLDKTSDHRHLDCRKHCPKRRNHSPKKKISRSQSRLARQGWFVYQTFSCIVRGFVHSSRDSWILSVSSHPRPSQWEFKFVRHNKRLLIWRMMRRMTVRLDKTSDHRHLDCRKHCPKRRNHSPKKKISRSQSRLTY